MFFVLAERNKAFLKSVITHGKVPDYKTVEKDLEKLEIQALETDKQADHYGVQFDH